MQQLSMFEIAINNSKPARLRKEALGARASQLVRLALLVLRLAASPGGMNSVIPSISMPDDIVPPAGLLGTLTLIRIPAKPTPVSAALLAAIKGTERRTFPTSEAFDFDTELRKRTTVLCAAVDAAGTLCGYVAYVRSRLATRVHKLCVVERLRRRGVGRWIMGEVMHELARGGAVEVDLWVDAGRAAARTLYVGCGFAARETVRDYYGAGRDGIRMAVDLREYYATEGAAQPPSRKK